MVTEQCVLNTASRVPTLLALGSHLPSLEEILHFDTSQENSDMWELPPLWRETEKSQSRREARSAQCSHRVDVLQPWGAAGDIPGVRDGVPCVQGAPVLWLHLRTAGESHVTAPPYSASSCGPQLIFCSILVPRISPELPPSLKEGGSLSLIAPRIFLP